MRWSDIHAMELIPLFTLYLSLSHTHAHTHTISLISLFYALYLTHYLSPTHTLYPSLSHTIFLSHTISLTHTHIHTISLLSLSLSQTHTYYLIISLSPCVFGSQCFSLTFLTFCWESENVFFCFGSQEELSSCFGEEEFISSNLFQEKVFRFSPYSQWSYWHLVRVLSTTLI